MQTLGPWFHKYWKKLWYWRRELREGDRTTTLRWPKPGCRSRPEHWGRKVFQHCPCGRQVYD